MRMPQAKFHDALPTGNFGVLSVISVMLFALPVGAIEPTVPWECSGFSEEAQSRCIRALTELQQAKITKIKKDLEVQEQTVQQLQRQVSQQASVTAELERQLADNRSRWDGSSSAQVYPPIGLSFRFGRDRFLGRSLWYGMPRYFARRLYGHGHRH